MNKNVAPSAREIYLASLTPEDELTARRAAEKAGIPESDPTWLLLVEVRRVGQETSRCTTQLQQATSAAVARIEHVGIPTSSIDDAAASRIGNAVGLKLSENERVAAALGSSINRVEIEAIRTMRTLETAIRDFMRRRAAAPAASLLFAFALGVATSCFSIWATYHVAISYGQDLGYRAGFHDARLYDRSHP